MSFDLWSFARFLVVGVLLIPECRSADLNRSWLSCVQVLSVPVVNDMNRATFRGVGRHTLTVDVVLDKNANVDLAPDWKAPKNGTIPMSLMLLFLSRQTYRKECAGARFTLSISMVLVDRNAGRQDSQIRDDNSIELFYHDNGSN